MVKRGPKKKWKCSTCNDPKQEGEDEGLECDICKKWVGVECSNYSEEVVTYLREKEVITIDFICKACKEKLPEIRSMLDVTKNQQRLSGELVKHDTRITRNEVKIEELELKAAKFDKLNTRLTALEVKAINSEEVETIAERCFKQSDFPAILEIRSENATNKKMLDQVLKSQKVVNEETQKREDIKSSLIVYGIKENKDAEKTDTMKTDFKTIKELYKNRVPISSDDIVHITRVGQHKENLIRPIKITFASLEKRLQVLRNNKDLLLYGDEDECEFDFCEDEDNHKHIYVSPDKTKQQRDEEKELRKELKIRKVLEPNLIIRNCKIITKVENHARWADVNKDGL